MCSSLPRLLLMATLFIITPAFALSACGGSSGGSGSGSGESSHRAGQDCLSSGCHDSSIEAEKRFTYAGTVFTGATSATHAAPGTVVTIVQNDGSTITATVDSSGNFYTRRGDPSGGYSSTIGSAMITQPTNGSCNTAGCHDSARRLF